MRVAIAASCLTVLTISVALLVVAPDFERLPPGGPAIAYIGIVLAWGFVGVGAFAWLRRPDNRTGMLMTLVGVGVALSGLQLFDSDLLWAARRDVGRGRDLGAAAPAAGVPVRPARGPRRAARRRARLRLRPWRSRCASSSPRATSPSARHREPAADRRRADRRRRARGDPGPHGGDRRRAHAVVADPALAPLLAGAAARPRPRAAVRRGDHARRARDRARRRSSARPRRRGRSRSSAPSRSSRRPSWRAWCARTSSTRRRWRG